MSKVIDFGIKKDKKEEKSETELFIEKFLKEIHLKEVKNIVIVTEDSQGVSISHNLMDNIEVVGMLELAKGIKISDSLN